MIQFFHSKITGVQVSAAGARRGKQGQTLGRSRLGFPTKSHIKTDLDANALDFYLTGGKVSGISLFAQLLHTLPNICPCVGITDKGCDKRPTVMRPASSASHQFFRASKTHSREYAIFRSASPNFRHAPNRKSARSSDSNALLCAARRASSGPQPSSVSRAG